MRKLNWLLPTLLASSLLAACGSGDNPAAFTSVVSFGDSLSDAGAYKVGTIDQLGGGKFTVNGNGGSTWTEYLAVSLNVPAQCAAQTGSLPNTPGITGAAVKTFANCYNYAQGSSRVSSSGTGPNGVALQTAFGQQNLGFTAISLKQQFTNHLAKVGGAFSRTDLVTVNAGGNDTFMQLTAVGSAFGGGQAAVATGTVAGWPQATLDVVALGGQPAVAAAGAAAVVAMGQAGAELAGYINTMVVDKGAWYIIVRNLGDINLTPFGRTLDAQTQGLITAMTKAFNSQLQAGLPAGVILYDDYAVSTDVAANPGKYGITNFTVQNCGPNAFGSPNGASIVCNTTNLIAGDTSKYAFSDSVHPTPFAHQQAAATALSLMVSAGWR